MRPVGSWGRLPRGTVIAITLPSLYIGGRCRCPFDAAVHTWRMMTIMSMSTMIQMRAMMHINMRPLFCVFSAV